MTIPIQLISEYDSLLQRIQNMLAAQHQHEWVRGLEEWRHELTTIKKTAILKAHASRSARSPGGMECIGEIALASKDQESRTLVDKLYAITKEIVTIDDP